MATTERRRNGPEKASKGSDGTSLRGDDSTGSGREWRGRLEELREERRSRKRVMRRLKEPLIGLTLAGAAAPLAYGAKQMTPAQPGPKGDDTGQALRRAAALPEDIEDAVGQRWAESAEDQAREETVEGAMARYGIERDLAEAIYDNARAEDIEPDIAYGLVKTESTFREGVESWAGARGLTQVMVRTAQWMMPEIKNAQQLYDRDTNLQVGFRYLRYLLDKYDDDVRLALLAYNRGPGTVDRILDRGGNPDNGYAAKVLRG